ncbi:MAG: DUF4440 domain-containing protein [Calditrichaeota bacterium]|nr:MAG: DUF4440 domain-containing protein [Calditrichota bacterium]
MKSAVGLVGVFALLFISCQRPASFDEGAAKQRILSVLHQAEQAWNDGDIEGYMGSYLRSDSLRFVGGKHVSYGWDAVLQKYKESYPDRASMGHLSFSDVTVTLLSQDAGFVFGRWRLERAQDSPNGVFTLILRKTENGWRIVHDHTS